MRYFNLVILIVHLNWQKYIQYNENEENKWNKLAELKEVLY